MKELTAVALLLALSAVAGAKPAPVEPLRPPDDVGKNISSVGAVLERDYFRAPQPQFNAGGFPCRLQPSVFDKTRLAESCR